VKLKLTILMGIVVAGCSSAPKQEPKPEKAETVPSYYVDKYATSPVQLLDSESPLAEAEDVDPFDFSKKPAGSQGTLKEALSRLLPGNCWKTYITPGLQNEAVEWPAGVDTDRALAALAERYGLAIDIDRKNCVITVDRRKDGQEDGRYYGVWRLNKGELLSDVLSRWAEQAGWGFEYHPDESYVIDHPAVLSGPLEGEDGVLVAVVESFKNSGMPLRVEFSTLNKVIHIHKRTTISGAQR
jgi:hypothetical protein